MSSSKAALELDFEGIAKTFVDFCQTIQALRDPKNGCPWDLKQTHKSLKKYLLEESYEVIQAIDGGDKLEILDELGDVLLQVVLHSQLACDQSDFTIEDVVRSVNKKMIRRHPHVFGPEASDISVEQVKKNWQSIKDQENKLKNSEKAKDSHLEVSAKIKKCLSKYPANKQSVEIGKVCEKVGFEWPDYHGVVEKIQEELDELKEALESKNKAHFEEELGDLYFSIHQLSRKLKVDPELMTYGANQKFVKRFTKMESAILADKKTLDQLDLKALESYWQQIKKQ